MSAMDEAADELERLREMVGPSETSYAELREDRDQAVHAAKQASAEAGELRGHIVDLSVQLSRARQDQEYAQVSAAMSPAERLVYRARRRVATSVTPRLTGLAVARAKQALRPVTDAPRFSVITTVSTPSRSTSEHASSRSTRRLRMPVSQRPGSSTSSSTTGPPGRRWRPCSARPSHAPAQSFARWCDAPRTAASSRRPTTRSPRQPASSSCCVDHDDVLVDGALASVARALAADESADVVYSDHDLMRPDGRCAWPMYKPDFSLERLRITTTSPTWSSLAVGWSTRSVASRQAPTARRTTTSCCVSPRSRHHSSTSPRSCSTGVRHRTVRRSTAATSRPRSTPRFVPCRHISIAVASRPR